MNLHLLRLFAVVVEQQNFSRAAEILCVTQSAVSKGVRELEHQLDLPLLERAQVSGKSLRGVPLTEHGQALYEHARFIFALERTASEDMRDRAGVRKGRLRVGASTTVGGYWLPAQLSPFMARHPQIEFELRIANTEDISRAILDLQLDIAFVEGTVSDPRIVSTIWKNEPLKLVAVQDAFPAAQRVLSAGELAAQTWLLREQGSGTRQVAQDWLDAHAIQPLKSMELGSNEAIARAVAAGAGVALLPAVVVDDLITIGRVRVLSLEGETTISRPLFQLELANRPRPPALQAFLAMAAPGREAATA